MKIAHIADLHIGSSKYSFRMDRIVTALKRVKDICAFEQVDLLVVCGDIFQARKVDDQYNNIFFDSIIDIHNIGITIMLIPGNHDIPLNKNNQSYPLYYIKTLKNKYKELSDLYISFDTEILCTMDNIDIVHFLYKDPLPTYVSYIGNNASSNRKIAISHAYIRDSILSRKRSSKFEDGIAVEIYRKFLTDYNIIGFFNGHIHTTQILSEKPLITYSGSLLQHTFDEEENPTGLFIYTIDDYDITHKFIDLNNRFFYTYEYNDNFIDSIIEKVNNGEINRKSVIKINYNENDKDKVNFNYIRGILNKYELDIKPNIIYDKTISKCDVNNIYNELINEDNKNEDKNIAIINSLVKNMCGNNEQLYKYYFDNYNKYL